MPVIYIALILVPKGPQIFQKSRSPLKISGTIRVTLKEFNTGSP